QLVRQGWRSRPTTPRPVQAPRLPPDPRETAAPQAQAHTLPGPEPRTPNTEPDRTRRRTSPVDATNYAKHLSPAQPFHNGPIPQSFRQSEPSRRARLSKQA